MHNLVQGIKHSRIASRSILSVRQSTPGLLSSSSSSSSASFTPRDRSTPPRPAGAKRNPFPHRARARLRFFTSSWCERAQRQPRERTYVYVIGFERMYRVRGSMGRMPRKSKCSSREKEECTRARVGESAREICVTIVNLCVITKERRNYHLLIEYMNKTE